MITLTAAGNKLQVVTSELLTSGSVNVNEVQFTFDQEWDELDKTAVFEANDERISVLLDDEFQCVIPWEVLQESGYHLKAGVLGTKNGEVILPTIWVDLGEIHCGVTNGDNTEPPTPDIYSQILETAEDAKEIAQSVRDDADAGKFDGEPGKEGPRGPQGIGIPEITAEDEGKFLGVLDGDTAWILGGSGSGNVSSPELSIIRVMDKADYDALEVKSATTLYLLRG